MLKPLKQWICDRCGQVIETPDDGYVIWKIDKNSMEFDFKIIHRGKCDTDNLKFPNSRALVDFLGVDGMTYLLSYLSVGPVTLNLGAKPSIRVKNFDEFIDFIRRAQTPHYEEARKKFNNRELLDEFSGTGEVSPFEQISLKKILKEYE